MISKFSPLFSFFLSLILFPIFSYIGRKINFVSSKPLHIGGREGISLTGGWVIFLVFSFFGYLVRLPYVILSGGAIIFLIGLWDDFREFNPFTKISFQSIIALLTIFLGIHTTIARIPFYLNYVITFLWILLITNSVNLLDIMDGLASGISIFPLLGMISVSYLTGNTLIFNSSFILLSIILSFLIFNFPPAKLFLGNSGSSFLGFLFSLLVIPLSFAPEGHEIALITPLLLLGLPIYDTFFLILERWKKGKPFHKKSEDHLALLLLRKGWTKKKVLFFMYSLSALLSICGILLTILTNFQSILLVSILIIVLVLLGKLVSK